MTDTELDVINYAIKFDSLLTTDEGYVAASTVRRVRKVILELVADLKQTRDELRQTRKERDWLANKLENIEWPMLTTWLEAAKETHV